MKAIIVISDSMMHGIAIVNIENIGRLLKCMFTFKVMIGFGQQSYMFSTLSTCIVEQPIKDTLLNRAP